MDNGWYRSQPILDFQGLNLTIATIIWPSGILATNWQEIYLGNIKRELKLNFEEGKEVHASCGATLNGQNWIIGGAHEKRQASDLSDNTKSLWCMFR